MDTATGVATEIVIDENMLDATEASGLLHLSPEAVIAKIALLQSSKTVCHV